MLLTRGERSAQRAAYLIRQALTPPDASTQPSVIRRIDPTTGRVLETLSPEQWRRRAAWLRRQRVAARPRR